MTFSSSSIAGIRRVARGGDTLRAWRMFEAAGLLDSADPEVLGLRGRLLKDRGLKAAGEDRARLLDDAAAAYLASAGDRRATYPLINAATIAFLNGQPDRAATLARRTIGILDSGDFEAETAYWIAATRAEAAFLLGNVDGGDAALAHAVAIAPEAWEDQAATLRQLRAILAHAGLPTDRIEPLRPPPCLHFGGLIGLARGDRDTIARIAAVVDDLRPGFVFGALAAGTDIVVAERAVAAGAELHVVLPASIEAFRARSVAPCGGDWAERFDRLIASAAAIEAPVGQSRVSRADVLLSEDVAMGFAIRRSRILESRVFALRVRRAADPVARADLAWQACGLPLHEIVVDGPAAAEDDDGVSGAPCAVLAFDRPLPPATPLPPGSVSGMAGGCSVLIVPALAAAGDFAVAQLARQPDLRVGLEYRVFDRGVDRIAEAAGTAAYLALAAPGGAILAACPGAMALDLHAPHLTFEAAGEIATPLGNVAVSMHQ